MRRRFDLAGFLLFKFIGGIVIFMLFWLMMNEFALQFFDQAIANGGTDRAQGAEYLRFAWTFGPALMLTIVSLGLLNRAVFESKGGVA